MSLINQMLQELDARRSDAQSGTHGGHIRAVPGQRRSPVAWILVLLLAVALVAMAAWVMLWPARPPVRVPVVTPVPAPKPPMLPLKLDWKLDTNPESSAQAPAPVSLPEAGSPAVPAASADPEPPAPVEPAPAPPQPAQANDVATTPAPVAKRERLMPDTRDARSATAPLPPKEIHRQAAPSTIHKQITVLTPQQQAENAYRDGLGLLQQGKTDQAIEDLERALQFDSRHLGAREALIGAYLDRKRTDDAARLAQDGLALDRANEGLAMILARLQVEKGQLQAALDTLRRSLPYAAGKPEYQAFLAALLQRDQRPKEAVDHYLLALRDAPQNGVWWMGLGIALQADQRPAEAREAFQRAKKTGALSPDLLAFVDNRLIELAR